jgi:hypothetical protein
MSLARLLHTEKPTDSTETSSLAPPISQRIRDPEQLRTSKADYEVASTDASGAQAAASTQEGHLNPRGAM